MFGMDELINEVRNFFSDMRGYAQLHLENQKRQMRDQQDYISETNDILEKLKMVAKARGLDIDAMVIQPIGQSPALETTQIVALTTQQIDPAVSTAPPVGFIAEVESEIKNDLEKASGIYKGFFK